MFSKLNTISKRITDKALKLKNNLELLSKYTSGRDVYDKYERIRLIHIHFYSVLVYHCSDLGACSYTYMLSQNVALSCESELAYLVKYNECTYDNIMRITAEHANRCVKLMKTQQKLGKSFLYGAGCVMYNTYIFDVALRLTQDCIFLHNNDHVSSLYRFDAQIFNTYAKILLQGFCGITSDMLQAATNALALIYNKDENHCLATSQRIYVTIFACLEDVISKAYTHFICDTDNNAKAVLELQEHYTSLDY